MKLSKELKAGIIVLGAIALFIFGFNFLKGRNLFSGQRVFYAEYNQINGLVESNPVLINGFRIGQIKDLSLNPKSPGTIIVTLTIDNSDINIPKNSIAKIISSDFLGSKAIEINLGTDKVFAASGDTLKSDIEASLGDQVGNEVKPLKEKISKLVSSLDSAVEVIQVIFNKDAREDILQSFESIKKSIVTFEHTARTLDTLVTKEKRTISSIFSKIESITANIANNNEKITQALNNITNITDSIAKSNLKSTIDNVNRAMANVSVILDKINKGEGTMGMLLNDKKLYNQLDSASSSMGFLIRDMEKYPGIYFPLKKAKKAKREKERDIQNNKLHK